MARPSMTALLAVLAIAGYQHRDKLGEMLGNATGRPAGPPAEGGRRGGQAAAGGAAGIGTMLSEGLRDLVDQFRGAGHGATADSWVAQGPNRDLAPGQVEQVIDRETLDSLARQTGLSREELIARLTRELPSAVDRYTPEGRIPHA